MINIMIYHTIANNDDAIRLSIMENEKGLYMPSLTSEEYSISWDNSAYIFGQFLTAIKNYLSRTLTKEDEEELYGMDWICEDIAEDIKEILEKGIELGWNKVN